MKVFLLSLLLLVVVAPVFVEAKGKCYSKKWVLPRNIEIKTIKKSLDKMKRDELVKIAWGEMFVDAKKSMAVPILHYLAGTEQNENLRGYFKSMGYLMNNSVELKTSIKKWPKRPKKQKSPYNLRKLCQLYYKSGGRFPAKK